MPLRQKVILPQVATLPEEAARKENPQGVLLGQDVDKMLKSTSTSFLAVQPRQTTFIISEAAVRMEYEGNERAYWEERIARRDRYSSIGVKSLPSTINRYRKQALFSVIKKALRSQAVDLKSARVLDAGCGTGIYSSYYASAGAHITGVDFSYEAVTATKKLSIPGHYCQAELAHLPFADAAFDVTHVFSVLYHIVDDQNWRASLHEVGRVTQQDGILLLRVDWIDKTIRRADHVKHRAREEYLRHLTEEGPFELGGIYAVPDLTKVRPVFALLHQCLPTAWSEISGKLVERFDLLGEHRTQKVVIFRKR